VVPKLSCKRELHQPHLSVRQHDATAEFIEGFNQSTLDIKHVADWQMRQQRLAKLDLALRDRRFRLISIGAQLEIGVDVLLVRALPIVPRSVHLNQRLLLLVQATGAEMLIRLCGRRHRNDDSDCNSGD
jgi:hypothetical protein